MNLDPREVWLPKVIGERMAMMVKYSQEKLQELILYVVTKYADDKSFDMTRLARTLFWSDFGHFRSTGTAITGVTYVRKPDGPAPDGFTKLLHGMESGGALRIELRDDQTLPIALRKPRQELFTSAEIATVDRVIGEEWGKSSAQVQDEAVRILGWLAAKPMGKIPYGAALISTSDLTPEEITYGLELSQQLAAAKHGA